MYKVRITIRPAALRIDLVFATRSPAMTIAFAQVARAILLRTLFGVPSLRSIDNTFRRFDEVGRGASIGTMAQIQGELAGGLRALHSRFGEAVSVTLFDYRNPDDPVRHEGWENLKILESEGSRDDIQQRLARHLQRHRDAGTITDNAIDKPPASPPLGKHFTHEEWMDKVLENMKELSKNPDRVSALAKRGF
jgi:hypothetical protein